MDVTELLVPDVEVGAVDDALVAQLPVRARVHLGPALHGVGELLRETFETRSRMKGTLVAELH